MSDGPAPESTPTMKVKVSTQWVVLEVEGDAASVCMQTDSFCRFLMELSELQATAAAMMHAGDRTHVAEAQGH